MKYFILANGEGKRWGNHLGIPKQLIEIDGETILHRMIRLLKQEGVEATDIFICGDLPDENAYTLPTKSKTKREVFEEIAKLAKEPFTILYGDCYYTEDCIHEIVNRPICEFDEFFTTKPNPYTGCPWGEGYAHRCVKWKWWRDSMHKLNSELDLGHIKLDTERDWFIHWWLLGARDKEELERPVIQDYDLRHDVEWLDETDDFDYPEDLDLFCKTTGHKCTNRAA